ncbi:sensor histidine kinase [Herbidospora mongoliensis]|uniref:sensor histidine kinase n=1 Tax=Herbidospora mongoliensis TaxID=688067 RepID=UPI00082B45FD|nr:ATP-binding protein [Herbidospora mongoliensis]
MTRVPVRVRLTLVYGGLFCAAALALVMINYIIVSNQLSRRVTIRLPLDDLPPLTGDKQLFYFNKQVDDYHETVLGSLVQWSLLAAVLVGLGGLMVGWYVAKRALDPLQRVTETARRLSTDTLHRRISMAGPNDEIKDLADTFDSMLERLDNAFDGQRRFVANASHELRTPLAINRALLQVSMSDGLIPAALRPVRDELLASNSRQERLIEGLLTLALSERDLTGKEPGDLAELAHPSLLAHGLTLPRQFPAPVVGDGVLLERMIRNLVDNAVAYNDDRAEVTVRTGNAAGHSYVSVENTGREIAPAQAARLFDPFIRLDADRTGSARGAGLGLSIVRAIARAHGGTAEARPRAGGGLIVTIRLPCL